MAGGKQREEMESPRPAPPQDPPRGEHLKGQPAIRVSHRNNPVFLSAVRFSSAARAHYRFLRLYQYLGERGKHSATYVTSQHSNTVEPCDRFKQESTGNCGGHAVFPVANIPSGNRYEVFKYGKGFHPPHMVPENSGWSYK